MRRGALIAAVFMWAAAPAAAADKTVLEEILTEVPRQYVLPAEVNKVAVYLLKGLKGVDKNLQVGDDSDKVTLYYKGVLQKSFYKPKTANDVTEWVDLAAKVIDLAAEKSPTAAKYDFELVDRMLAAAMPYFDEDSKFYPNPESMRNGRPKHRVNFAARLEGDLLYIKIAAFNSQTEQHLSEALNEYKDVKGAILDLRGSPGGMLSEAVGAAGVFIDGGIVVSTQGRNAREVVYYEAEEGDAFNGKPLVVLVDGKTASAAEVMAAALQEQGRAKVVGTRTYGKGSVQNLINLSDGATLSLTSAYYYTPSGMLLHGVGVVPNFCTYEMPQSKNPERLIEMGENRFCERESREDEGLDLDVAKLLLEK